MKKHILTATALTFTIFLASGAEAQNALTAEQLNKLTANGIKLTLGGPDMGYTGELVLRKNGTGKGMARTNDGTRLTLTGTWRIAGDKFCRTWEEFDGGNEVCETWVLTSSRSVDVFRDGEQIGRNSW